MRFACAQLKSEKLRAEASQVLKIYCWAWASTTSHILSWRGGFGLSIPYQPDGLVVLFRSSFRLVAFSRCPPLAVMLSA